MSDQIPRGVFALSIVAGICWIVRLLRPHVWQIIESFGGVERLIVGLFLVTAIDYSGEVLVTVLALRLFWMVRGDRSFFQLEREVRIAVLAGVAFLIVTPFSSGLFYYLVPQPESRPVTTILHVSRTVSVALLIGGLLLARVTPELSPSS